MNFLPYFHLRTYVAALLLLPGKLADNDYFFVEPKTFTWKSGKPTKKIYYITLCRHRFEDIFTNQSRDAAYQPITLPFTCYPAPYEYVPHKTSGQSRAKLRFDRRANGVVFN